VTQPAIRFVGGMNVPAVVGRANASVPLAVLTVEEGRLYLRPRAFGAWMITDFSVALGDITAAFPLRPGLLRFGVGFEMTDREVAYFWTWRGDEVLRALAWLGVHVDPVPHRASAVWRLRTPRGRTVTQPTAYSPALVALYPFTTALSVIVLVVLLATNPADVPWFPLLLVPIWLAGFMATTTLWWRSRRRQ
jgi:hypothetical protein